MVKLAAADFDGNGRREISLSALHARCRDWARDSGFRDLGCDRLV